MPCVINQGVSINYEIEGKGPSLILLHGGLGNLKVCYEMGYIESLKNDFQLILIARARLSLGRCNVLL